MKWFCKAAKQNDAEAQTNLAAMYYNGRGIQRDYAVAAEWMRKAAEQNCARAQKNLDMMCELGHGVLKDLVRAHAWFNVASSNGDEYARTNLPILEKMMTRQQKAEATKLARYLLEELTSG